MFLGIVPKKHFLADESTSANSGRYGLEIFGPEQGSRFASGNASQLDLFSFRRPSIFLYAP